MINWMFRRWRKKQRELDKVFLWDSLKNAAPSITEARQAMRMHMDIDSAYCNMSDAEKDQYVEELE